MNNFGIVIVTYNRLDMLRVALAKFEFQTFKPKYILVVNNNSNDGTKEFLTEWEHSCKRSCDRYVIDTKQNLGGSGGFYYGLKFAQDLDADWIWVSDDDAFPYNNALEEANIYISEQPNTNAIAAVCGAVINNGCYDYSHRRNIYKGKFRLKIINSNINDYSDNFVINTFSYVGTILNREKLIAAGLPNKDYFIWYDDTEHSIRVSKQGQIVCVPSIKVEHNCSVDNTEISWKTYYGIRNSLDMMHKHFIKNYYIELMIIIVKILIWPLLGKGIKKSVIYYHAMRDQILGNLGVHRFYKPGWKIEDN